MSSLQGRDGPPGHRGQKGDQVERRKSISVFSFLRYGDIVLIVAKALSPSYPKTDKINLKRSLEPDEGTESVSLGAVISLYLYFVL